jgi:beta-lactamase class A
VKGDDPMSERVTDTRWAGLREAAAKAPAGATVAVTAIDLVRGDTFDVLGGERFKAASTIKTLVLATLARGVDEKRLALTDSIALPERRKVGGSGVLNWMTTGIELPLTDYAWLMIAVSDNTASNVCIDAATIPAIQAMAAELELPDLFLGRFFLGRSPAPGEPENIATTNDLARLLAAIDQGKVASAEPTAWMLRLLADQQHRDRLPRCLPDGVTYAGKTGSIEDHDHDCGILSGPNGKIAIAVLTREFGSSYAADEFIGDLGRAAAATIA